MIRCSTSASRQPRPHLHPWKRSLRKMKSRLKADAANTQSISPTPMATPSNTTVTSQWRESFEGRRNEKKISARECRDKPGHYHLLYFHAHDATHNRYRIHWRNRGRDSTQQPSVETGV